MLSPAEPAGAQASGQEAGSQDAASQDVVSQDTGRPSRRRLFGMGAAVAAAVLAPRRAAGQRIVRPPSRRPPEPEVSGDVLLRLVRRASNGVTPEEIARADSLGFRKYLDAQLKPASIDDSAVDTFVTSNYPNLSQPGTGLYQLNQNALMRELSEATLYRAAFSKRQLYERMVHFWSDHFNIYFPKVNYLKVIDDREVIRKHALGRFPDMLRASAHSPAMLEYLDNTRSRGRNVNQNYARELMELHTLGVDGGYTQTDVEEVTRCLTGWTIAGRGEFRFDPNGHDFTAKTVLGTAIPALAPGAGAAGIQDGETVLDLLLAHPSTARFIATKMSRWLLEYEPPAALVDDVADTFTRTDGDIPSMIRTILTPTNLMAAPAKYRQPYQLVLAALRATGVSVSGLRTVANITNGQLRNLGQPLFQWEEPDGYPDDVEWWAGSILQRWNFCSYVCNLATADATVNVTDLMQVNTAQAIADAINERVFAGELPPELLGRVSAYLTGGIINEVRVREALALALSSNEFQWY